MKSADVMNRIHECTTSITTRISMGLIIGLAVLAGAWNVSAGSKTYPASAENLPPVTVIQEGQERTIRLTDVYDFHGNACPGATMAFQALRYGLELLYGKETPDVNDLVIISRSAGGPMDLFDLMMKGRNKSKRTWPPAGMTMGAENFEFQFLRKSTMQSVTVRLQDGLWPADWFELRAGNKAGTLTDEEKQKRKEDREHVISTFPGKPLTQLFGNPSVYTIVAWGQILPGEIDRHIRDQRKENKRLQKAE
jgi:hypothetical protein